MPGEGIQQAIEAAPIPMVLVDDAGVIRLANGAACALIGAPLEAVLGLSVERLVPDGARAHHAADRAAFMRDPVRRDMGLNRDLCLLRLDGERVPVEIGLNPLRIDDRTYVLCSILDLTERRRAAEDLVRLEQQAAEADRLRSLEVLAGGVAHDFNNMLVSVLGNASLLKAALEDNPELVEWVEDIEAGATQAAELAKQMLAFSGGGRFVIEPTEMTSLVRSFLPLLRALTPSGVGLRSWLKSSEVHANVDRNQIRQVVTNLVGNAVDATKNGSGTIGLRVSGYVMTPDVYAQGIWHGERFEGPAVSIEVSDDGVGIAPEILPRVFEPFFTTRKQGHGMGLAALLGIVRGHDGCLTVYSEPGAGTTFKVFLPTIPHTADLASGARDPASARAFEVLVIDDEPSVLRLVERALRRSGFSVTCESDSAAGVEAFRALHDDLDAVLLDLSMPGLDGHGVYKALARIDSTVPVVIMSGFAEQEIEQRFIGRKIGCLTKPFSAEVLVRTLERACRTGD